MAAWGWREIAVCAALVGVSGCGGTAAGRARSVRPQATPPSLDHVLRHGGPVFRVADGRCLEWTAEPSSEDPKSGSLSVLEADGYSRNMGYWKDAGASIMLVYGEVRFPETPAAKARENKILGMPKGWGLIGRASMCTSRVPVRQERPGVYIVDGARWYLTRPLCERRRKHLAIAFVPPCNRHKSRAGASDDRTK